MAKKRKHIKRAARAAAGQLKPGKIGFKLLTVAAGYLLADKLNPEIDKLFIGKDPVNPKPVPGKMIIVGEIGLGGLLLMGKAKANPTAIDWGKEIVGGVLAGAGLKRALKDMGVIKGFQNVPVIGARRMAGFQSVPVIGGTAGMPSQLSGSTPSQLQGYRVNGRYNNGYVPHGSGLHGKVVGNALGNSNGSGLMHSSGYMDQ